MNIYSNKDKAVISMEEVVNCSHPGEPCHSVGFCCWQSWHSTTVVARLALVSGSPWFECIIFITATMATWFFGPLGNDREGWRRTDCPHSGSSYPLNYWTTLLLKSPFDNYLQVFFSFFAYPERSIHILLLQMSFSLIFHLYYFQIPDHLANPRVTYRLWISKQSQIWPSILLSKIYNHMYCPKLCPLY